MARTEAKAKADPSGMTNSGQANNGQANNGQASSGPANKGMANKGLTAKAGPIKHVIYIIKENRTYDQILGDLAYEGTPVGNGDKSLTMYGRDITPNQHKLALQFGVLDNFYDSAEVSGDGHVWSNSAIGTDYLERTWQLNYRGRERGYDFEGVVSQGLPLEQNIPDVNEPGSGYIWTNVAKHGLTLMHFGEYISSTFCNDKEGAGAELDPTNGPMGPGKACAEGAAVKPGEKLPTVWGGGINKWPVGDPAACDQQGDEARAGGPFRKRGPGLQSACSGPGAGRHFFEASRRLDRRPQGRPRYHAQLHQPAPGQRPHGRNDARRTDPEIVGRG